MSLSEICTYYLWSFRVSDSNMGCPEEDRFSLVHYLCPGFDRVLGMQGGSKPASVSRPPQKLGPLH